jgi:hypothetical protein
MVALCHQVEDTPVQGGDLRMRYFTALNRLRNIQVPFVPNSLDPFLAFDLDRPETRQLLLQFFATPDELGDCFSVEDQRDAIINKLDAALHLLDEYSENIAGCLRLLFGCLLLVGKRNFAGGASLGGAYTGVVWISLAPEWDPTVFAESMLHESVHQALFLEEIVNGLFADDLIAEMATERGLVASAVWPYNSEYKARRPYDRAFHAACVGAVLSDFYQYLALADKALQFSQPLGVTTRELREKAEFLLPRGNEILSEVSEWVQS